MEEKIGIKTIEFNHDSGSDGEPDRRKDRGCREELFHGVVQTKGQMVSLRGRLKPVIQQRAEQALINGGKQ
jgi:hypothetical protein